MERIRNRRLRSEPRATRRVIKAENTFHIQRATSAVRNARALVRELKVDKAAVPIIETAKLALEQTKSHLNRVKKEATKKL
ncbi:hypothetical protein SLS61_005064 [Didymella pomorum]